MFRQSVQCPDQTLCGIGKVARSFVFTLVTQTKGKYTTLDGYSYLTKRTLVPKAKAAEDSS
ncbi:hypothetical protein FAZ19_06555 [Sphingobacterium alkalisoli]|uniref:Uncharacterized protein n=1 Tax=Sphingobacterium alkalisoli TaxID=1874115 RepID=A0A4V5LYH6_9SPHI|nr:hypothetical protein [Sphingobacterium alkalisoli]TJY66579.1 hypothetical protein FAZ19_06555 [Sphingobacterium alkalisoli]